MGKPQRLVIDLKVGHCRSAKSGIVQSLQYRRLVDITREHLLAVDVRKKRIAQVHVAKIVSDVACHRDALLAHLELVLLVIPLRKIVRILHHAARIVREPEIHSRLEQESCGRGDQQGRHCGNQRKEEYQAHVEASRGSFRPPQGKPATEQHYECHCRHESADQKTRDLA